MKKHALLIIALSILLSLCACGIIRKPIDDKTGFSKCLKETENQIRSEDWQNALNNLENANLIWKRIKPILQLDVDHDYVNSIENNFIILRAYIETKERSDSLAIVLLIEKDWENIGSM